jgi:hypothetical protein
MKNSLVYKLIPKDIEQGAIDSNINWYNDLKVFLNQLPVSPNSEKFNSKGIMNFILPEQSSDEYYYKFYSLSEKIYLETNYDGELNIPETKLVKIEAPNELIIGLGRAYAESVLESDYVKVNGTYFRLVNLYEFSKGLMPSELMDYGDYCVFLKRLDPTISKRKVNIQRKLHHSNLHSHIRNIESETSFTEAEKITEAMINGEESLFKAEAWFIIMASTEEELNIKTNQVIQRLKQIEAEPLIETVGLRSLFLSILFGVKPTFKRTHEPPTSYVVNMLPMIRDHLHEEGISLSSMRGNEIFFNLFDDSALNFNVLISGQSGTGKSMIAQKILKEEVQNGSSAIVLDLGNSFKKTVNYLGGESLSKSFNPLQFKSPHYLKELIVSVIPENELSSKIEGKIFSLVSEHAISCKSFRELITKLSLEIPDLDLYFSELWEFFDSETRSLSKLTYVDTSLYPDKIKAPLIIYLIECFKHLEGRRIFIFDEVWSFLNKNADYITECFRTFRKHGASAIAISQGLEDFIQTPLGLAIAQNSFTKFYFNQSITTSSFIDSFDHFRIKELMTKKGSHSEFYLKSEVSRKQIHFHPTYLEYELFTSNYEDNLIFEAFLEENKKIFKFWEVLDRYVHFKYFYGGLND